jgi:hypothetical protein
MAGGRPTKLTQSVRKKVARLAPLGLTDKQFSAVLGVAESTFNLWKKDQEFSESLKACKEDADVHVVSSLYSQALLGNPTACIFWLKNRQPDKWRDKAEVDLGQSTSNLIERLTKALERTG